jgi:hypothetical protein
MNRLALCLAAVLTLAGCGSPLAGTPGGTGAVDTSLDVGALGGLKDDIAAHPSVQLAQPRAFALTPASAAFLEALDRSVEPQRRALAQRLADDATVSTGIARWDRMAAADRFAMLERVADLEGEVMGFQVPPITPSTNTDDPNVQAYFQPENNGLGEIVIFTQTLARGNAYRAIATVVHEARHAAQFQLAFGSGAKTGDDAVLGDAYASAWAYTNALGDESKLAYGDYVHLNAEYDAFQTGNEVAALLSGGALDTLGYGFVTTQYDRNGKAAFDPLGFAVESAGRDLIAAVNQAEAQLERTRGRTATPQRDRRGRTFTGR